MTGGLLLLGPAEFTSAVESAGPPVLQIDVPTPLAAGVSHCIYCECSELRCKLPGWLLSGPDARIPWSKDTVLSTAGRAKLNAYALATWGLVRMGLFGWSGKRSGYKSCGFRVGSRAALIRPQDKPVILGRVG